MVRYMLARLVLFVLAVTVLGVAGFRAEVALIGGLLISALLSYVLLRRLRDASTAAIVERVQARQARRSVRLDEDTLVEDTQSGQTSPEPDRRA